MIKTQTIEIGSKVHVATDLRYVGAFTVEAIEGDIVTVISDKGRGRCNLDQCYASKKDALVASQTPIVDGWSNAAQLNNRIGR